MKRHLISAWLTLLLALTAQALAQSNGGWSVQTVALRDLREAQRVVADLRAAGFPAFTEFTMADGLQYVRVRAGCWTSRDGAAGVATLLLAGYAREAEVVPHSEGSPWQCVEVDVGFLTPATWTSLHGSLELPTFRVEIAGHVAHIRHDGERWSVLQGELAPPAQRAELPTWRYRAGTVGGGAVVLDPRERPALLLCPGELIGQVGEVAVVAWSDAVVACRPPAGALLANP